MSLHHVLSWLITAVFLVPGVAIAQPNQPFITDQSTMGLWHLDSNEPVEDWTMEWDQEATQSASRLIYRQDGSIIISGTSQNGNDRHLFLMEVGIDGEINWTRSYRNLNNALFLPWDMVENNEGEIVIAGQIRPGRIRLGCVAFFNPEGEFLEWQGYNSRGWIEREIHATNFVEIIIDNAGNYIIACESTEPWSRALSVVKIDRDELGVMWSVETNGHCGYSLVGTLDNGCVIGGEGFRLNDPERSAYIARIDPAGEILWERNFGEFGLRSTCADITAYQDGFLFSGNLNYVVGQPRRLCLFLLDSDGDVIWSTENENAFAFDHIRCWDDRITTCGDHFTLTKYTQFGLPEMSLQLIEDTRSKQIVQLDDMSYLMYGYDHLHNWTDVVVVKTEPDIPITSDYSDNHLNGTYSEDHQSEEGMFGQGLVMENEENSILVRNHEKLCRQVFTVECHFSMVGDEIEQGVLVGKNFNDEFDSYQLFANSVDSEVGFSILTDNQQYTITFETDPDNGVWHHIAGSYNRWARSMKMFYDGELVGEMRIDEPVIYSEEPLIIGATLIDVNAVFTGIIDEVRLSDVNRYSEEEFIISFERGWNMVSSPVFPPEGEFVDIWAEFVERGILDLVKDQDGNFYSPRFQFNNILVWDVRYGYQVKVTEAEEISFLYNPVQVDTPIPVGEGWSLVAFFPEEDIGAPESLSNLGNNLILAKDQSGRFYLPAQDFCNMEPLRRGQGYQVNVQEAADLIWNNPARLDQVNHANDEPSYFPQLHETSTSMSLLIISQDSHPGEMAAFSSDGTIVGASVIQADGRCGLAVWGDDPTTVVVDGLRDHEKFTLRTWNSNSQEIEKVKYINGLEVSELVFKPDGLSIIEISGSISIPREFNLCEVYPNPFNSKSQVEFSIPERNFVEIAIYDISGRRVKEIVHGKLNPGFHKIVFEGRELAAGLYIMEMKTSDYSGKAKIVHIK